MQLIRVHIHGVKVYEQLGMGPYYMPHEKNWTILLVFWQDNGICCKNLAFKLTLICESRAWRGQIEKIRSLLY